MKKAFFDGWDHLFGLVLLNLAFVLLGLGLLFIAPLLAALPSILGFCAFGLLCLAASVYFSGCVFALNEVADNGALGAQSFFAALKRGLAPGLQVGGLMFLAGLALGIGLPFYLARGVLGAIAAGFLLWTFLILALALQWFLPLRARLGGGFAKNFRKSLVLLFDNPGFSLFLAVYNLAGLALSLVLVMLAPGPAGTALALDEALKLRLLKYDWLEAQAQAPAPAPAPARRSRVPWAELLAEERELVGKRTLKGLIFPWKE